MGVKERYEAKKKNLKNNTTSNQTEASIGKTTSQGVKERYEAKKLRNTINFDTLSSDLDTLSKSIGNAYSGWQSRETMENTLSSMQSMYDRIGKYQEYQKSYGGTDLSELRNTYKAIIDDWDSLSRKYRSYDNAEAYNKAVKDSAELYKRQSSADIGALQTEITSLEDILKNVEAHESNIRGLENKKNTWEHRSNGLKTDMGYGSKVEEAQKELDKYLKSVGYDSVDALKKDLGEKKVFKTQAERLQNLNSLSSVGDKTSKNYDKDYEKYVASGQSIPTDEIGTSKRKKAVGKGRPANTPKANDDLREVALAFERRKNGQTSSDSSNYYDRGAVFDLMTDEEFNNFYYYLGKDKEDGGNKAQEYVDAIADSLNSRRGEQISKLVEEKPWGELGFSIEAGLDQWASGMKANLSDKDYIPSSPVQYASGIVRENVEYEHGDFARTMYDFGVTGANQLPSILVSTALGYATGGVGAGVGAKVLSGMSKGAGLATMGFSARGNAYQEMLNLGYDKDQATTYANLTAASEVGLQALLGGIGKLGGTSGKIAKMVEGIDNGFARFAIQWGGSVASEATEEGLQEILNPLFQNIAAGYDTGAEVDWSEVAYSALLGGLMGGMFEGPGLVGESVAEHRYNKGMGQTIKANERVSDLFDIASMPEVASAYETYTRYANKGVTAENISDVQLGRLYGKAKADNVDILNSKESTEEQKTDALKRLAELSNLETENTVRKEAKQEFNVGEETKVTESGDAIDIKSLKVKGDAVTVSTDKGEISIDEVTLTQNDAELAVLAKGIAKTDGEDVANLFISQYDGKTNPEAYAISFNQTMAYAKNNYTHDEILNKKGNLSAEQVSAIYAETRIKADKERAEYIKKLNKKMADKGFYKGFIDESVIDYNNTSAEGKVNWNDLTDRQRKAVTFIKGFAQATGMNLEFVANNSKYNGKYDRATNTFTINLDKGGFDAINNLQETIIPTMSHETTHWMKEKSPELWRNLNEIVFSTLTEHYNSNTEQAIKDKIALLDRLEPRVKHTEEDAKGRVITEEDLIRAEMNRKGKSEDVSREEIIARACEDMLKMSEQGRKIFFSLSEAEQKTLVGKIKSLINDLLNWVNDLLNSYEATSTEARIMREYKEQLQKASKVWDEMLKKSVEANQSLEKSGAYEHKKSTSEGDVLEQAKELDSNGNSYWQIETEKDIFAGIDTVNELQKAAYNFILNGDKGNKIFGTIDGAKIEFIRVSAREYVYGEASKTLTTEEYKQKMRMSTSIIDLIENASIEYDSPDHKNHKLFPNGFKNYQGRVGIDETIFRYIVRVGKSKDGMIFYDINLEVDGKVPRAKRTSLIKSSTSNDSILNSDKIVKEKNSDKTIDGYAKANEMQKEINQFTEQIRQMESSDDFEAIMGVIKNDTEKGLAEYNKWLKESGYSEIREKRDALQNELNQLRKDLQESSKQKALDEEQKAIEKSGLSEADYFRKQAVKEFGYTPYFYDAGYITPNGKMLNFSGEKGMHYGSRGQDHRAIGIVYANVEGSKAMVKFMGEGNIRIMAESPGLDISSSVVPTTEQYATIRKFVREYANKEYFNIDLTDAEGHTIGNYEYEGKISAERVVNDIKYFFENGTTREQSSISQFLYSDKNTDIATQINTSMNMDEAKQMIQRAFVIGGIYDWYDREYKNGDEWLRGVGTSEVALNIENEYTLTEKYLNKLEGYIDGDFYVEDILEAYLNGTLVGKEKPKAKRLDISKEYRINDDRFYSPQRIKDAKKLLSVATQRMTEKNRKEISDARAKVLIFAHNKGASELLGMTQAELNKKLRAWSNYSAKARDISKRFNNGVADSNKWTGIENCSWLYKGTVTTKDLESLVKSVKGASSDYEKFYIARTMLALDTHIDWSWLSFEFDTYNEVNKGKTFSVSKCLGYYTNESRKIVVTHDKPHTVAHEMGHALDYQWARDLGFNYEALTEVSRHTERITDAETKQFFENFRIFIDSLTDNGDIRSEYTQNPKEVFARFVARFVQWVENTGTGRNSYNIETSYYNDKFTASNYIEFVKLLQEKAMLDAKKMESNSLEEVRFSEKDNEYLELAKDPIKNEARLREMVYEAAKKAGYTDDSSWRMEHSAPNSRDDVSLDNLKESGLVPDDFWEHPEWYTYSAEERESYYKVKKALERQEKLTSEGKTRDAYMWVYRAVDKTKNTKEDYFRNGDWVTPSYDYAVNEGKMNPNGYRIIKHSVSIKHLYWDGNSIAELGYDDGNNYAYADTLNNRKLLDAVTYDDDGNVIPLSKRFKRRNWDVRFSEKDSEGNTLSEGQIEFFRDSKVRDNKGRLAPVYHGTTINFNVFKKGDVGYHFGTKGAARGRAGYGKNVIIKEVYLNITNPIVFDEDLGSWDADYRLTRELYERGILSVEEAEHILFTDDKLYKRSTERANELLAKVLKSKGYDGIKYQNTHETKKATTSYIAFSPEQIKLTSNTNPTDSNDTRYSEKEQGIYDVMGETERIRKENEKFKAEVERLKERLKIERKVTNGNYFNENQLGAVAGHLRNISKSNMDKVELMKSLKDVYSFIAHSENLTWEEVFERCYNVADAMLAEAKPLTIVDDYSKYLLREIRNTRISLDETQKKEAEYHFGKNWNRHFMGKVIIANDAINIDAKWQEWANSYPDIFDADTNSGDMIGELYDIIDSLKEASETIDEYGTEEQKRWLAKEIYNQYWNVSPIRTTADKYDKQIKRLNFEHRRAMSELRDDYNTRLKEQHKVDKEKQKKLVKEIRERKDREIALAKEHGREMMSKYKENAERKTVLQSTMATVMSLNKKLTTNSKDVHIPDSLKPVVINLLNSIDFSSKQLLGMEGTKRDARGIPTKADNSTENALSKVHSLTPEKADIVSLKFAIQDALELFENGKDVLSESSDGTIDSSIVALDLDMVDDIKKMIRSLDILESKGETSFVLQKMSVEHLKTLNAMVKSINHWAIVADKALANKHKQRISELSMQTIEENDILGERQEYIEAIENIKTFFNWSNLLPVNAFKRLGDAATVFFDSLRDSQDTVTFNRQEIMDFTDKLLKEHKDIKKWRTDVKVFDLKLPNGKTKTVRMPISYIMSLYCVAKQEDAQRHMYGQDKSGGKLTYTDSKGNTHDGGGITISGFKEEGISLKVSKDKNNTIINEEIVKRITSVLTNEQREVADALQKYMNDKGSEWGNAVSMALYGIKKFSVKDYFPMKVSPNTLRTNNAEDKRVSMFSIINYGFTKERNPQASQSLEIGDIFDVFANHMNMVAIYNAYALAVYDIARWYNYKGKSEMGNEISVTTSIENAFGSGATTYVRNLIKDLNGQHESSRLGFISKMFKNAKSAMVGFSPSVTLLQPTAYFKAMTKISPQYLLKAALYVKDFGARKGVSKAKEYCGIALLKSQGYFETGVSANTTTKLLHDESFKEKAVNLSLKGAEFFDETTWGVLWNACEFEVRTKRKDLKVGSPEFYEVVAKKLSDVIYETQVVDSPLTKSDLMRSPDTGAKMVTMFASEMTVAYNIVAESLYDVSLDVKRNGKEGSLKRNGKRILTALTAYTLTSVANATVTTAIQEFLNSDDDDEETTFEKFLSNFISDWLIVGKIPYFKESLSYLQGYSASRPDLEAVEAAIQAYRYWEKIVSGKAKENTLEKAIYKTLQSLSYAYGVGVHNIEKNLVAILKNLGIIN